MRGRISRRIDGLLEADPGNLHLRRQQILLSHAHISTIHSFCADLVRENFFRLGIAPDFRILEDTELKVLREDALEKVLNRYYEQDDSVFFQLADAFSTGRDDWKMAAAVETVYDFVRSHPFEERCPSLCFPLSEPDGNRQDKTTGIPKSHLPVPLSKARRRLKQSHPSGPTEKTCLRLQASGTQPLHFYKRTSEQNSAPFLSHLFPA